MDNHFMAVGPGSSLGSSLGSSSLLQDPLHYNKQQFINRSPDGPLLKHKFKLEPMSNSQITSQHLGSVERSAFDKTPVF